MKVLSISFWGGIITAVLFFITMLCFAWDDGRMHEKEIKIVYGNISYFSLWE